MENEKIGIGTVFSVSMLVLGNVLGVGALALPITAGLGGYIPAITGIILIWLIMLISAFIIIYRIDPAKKNFDMPSFYQREMGVLFKWIAIACNIIILYGVLVAYLCGISTMISKLFSPLSSYETEVTLVYFLIAVCLIIFGLKVMRRGISLIILIIWISFLVMISIALKDFKSHHYLFYHNWKYLPVCLPIAVSAFHFHNIIPTVTRALNYNKMASAKAVFIGVSIGLFINITWVTVVLGTIPVIDNNSNISIAYANAHGLTANVPMSEILHSKLFVTAGLIFSIFAVTSSFMANGAGLFGFIRDLTYSYLKVENKLAVSALSFLPPLMVALIYPNLFLSALSIVGGIGETILFGLLPGIVLLKISKGSIQRKKKITFNVIGYIMIAVSILVLFFVIGQQTGVIKLLPQNIYN